MTKAVSAVRSFLADGLANVFTGQGVPGVDRGTGSYWTPPRYDARQIANAYATSPLLRKAVDAPSADMTRNWREWQADGEDGETIKRLEAELSVRSKVEKAHRLAQVFGGALLVMVTNNDLSEPLPDGIGLGALRNLIVLDRRQIEVGDPNRDVTSPEFGLPERYTTTDGSRTVIHASRCIRFDGPADPNATDWNKRLWGMSRVQVLLEAVDDFTRAKGNLVSLTDEALQDMIAVPKLMARLIDDKNFEQHMAKRLTAWKLGKTTNRVGLMDAEEVWHQKQAQFGGLPQVVHLFAEMLAAAADIPVTRLLGQSPGGLNSTGESDSRNYYDALKGTQQNVLRPALEKLDAALIPAAGVNPDAVSWDWRPLWTPTEAEESERGKRDAETLNIYATAGLVEGTALQAIAESQLTANPAFPGAAEAFANRPGDDLDEPLIGEGEGEDPEGE